MASADALPTELRDAISAAQILCKHYMAWQNFMFMNASRDSSFREHDLMVPAMQYVTESSTIQLFLLEHGALRVCTRELRFLVDVSLKLCLTHQAGDDQLPDTSLESRLRFVQEHLDRTAFSREVGRVDCRLLAELADDFVKFAKSFYDDASGYVHLSASSLREATTIEIGRETPDDVVRFTRLLERGFTVSLVFMCHAVPEWVVGDYCVEPDGSTIDSPFMASRFLARIDENFDYKHERKEDLDRIRHDRTARIRY